jgi:hypothetical protein
VETVTRLRRRYRRRTKARSAAREARGLHVPLSSCRNLGPLAFSCGGDDLDPFAATVAAHVEGRCSAYEESPLATFFERWQPMSRAELVGLESRRASAALQQPPDGSTPPMPWGAPNSGAKAAGRLQRSDLRAAAERIGMEPDELSGSIYHGPVSAAFGAVTYERLVAIATSIRRDGFRPGEGRWQHVDARILVRDDDHRVLIVSGKHRIAALSGLGYASVRLRVGPHKPPVIVDRRHGAAWPNVLNGMYTLPQALELFDRLFAGEQPRGCPPAT